MCMRRTRLLKRGAGEGQENSTRNVSVDNLIDTSKKLDRYKLQAYIPTELHERLIKYILRVHGGRIPHGAKSATVAELLALALDQVEHTHEGTRPAIATPTKLWRDMAICDRIMLELADMGLRVGREVHFRVLAAAIKNVRGFDPRTIKKWIKRLRELGYIEPSKIPNFWIITSIPGEKNGIQT